MNNMQLQYKEFLGYQFFHFDNFRSISPLNHPAMPTRPCSIASAPTARTDGCTCPYGALHTRNNRAGSMEADFWPKKQVFSVQNTHPRAHKAAPLEWAPRAARAGGRGTGGCLRLCVPVPTHQRTAVGVYMTEKYRGRPDPHPHRACTRRGASCSRAPHPRADRTCATGNGRAGTHGGGQGSAEK